MIFLFESLKRRKRTANKEKRERKREGKQKKKTKETIKLYDGKSEILSLFLIFHHNDDVMKTHLLRLKKTKKEKKSNKREEKKTNEKKEERSNKTEEEKKRNDKKKEKKNGREQRQTNKQIENKLIFLRFIPSSKYDKILIICYFLSTLCFMLCWQFAQFILLTEAVALFLIYYLGYLDLSTFLRIVVTLEVCSFQISLFVFSFFFFPFRPIYFVN